VNYLRFFLANRKILLFSIFFTFFSGFGQTFLLSIYIPNFLEDFSISRTFYSTIYSGATILSGLTIIFAGKYIDRISLKTFSVFVILGLTVANLFASFAVNAITLFISVFLLRFFGQGLSSHTAMTVAGKYFHKARGKALSIAYLGFPFTEGLMPSVIVATIALVGWRNSFRFSALSVLMLLLPIVLYLLYKFKPSDIKESFGELSKSRTAELPSNDKMWTQREIVRGSMFYFIVPSPFIVGFVLTALFFFQSFIAGFKGWTLEWMALNITAYAISSFLFSIFAGPIIDKFTAKKVFPFVMLPLVVGLGILFFFNHPASAAFYWFFVGITAGLNSTVANALYAEVYGTLSLGSIRSLFAFVMIAGTAMGPVIYSLLLDFGLAFNTVNLIFSLIILIYATIVYLKFNALKEQSFYQ
jgi:MFS family permease